LTDVLKISSFNSVTIFQPNKADIHTLTICQWWLLFCFASWLAASYGWAVAHRATNSI